MSGKKAPLIGNKFPFTLTMCFNKEINND